MADFDYVFHGTRASLDFVNTVRRRKDPQTPTTDVLADRGPLEWVNEARKKAAWAKELPLPIADFSNEATLTRALVLRNAIYSLVTVFSDIDGPTDFSDGLGDSKSMRTRDALAVLNECNTLPAFRLSLTGTNGLQVAPTLTGEELLGFIAADAIQLLGSDSLDRVKECEHSRCGMLFADNSNGMKRQWCSMKECGNRAKVARFSAAH